MNRTSSAQSPLSGYVDAWRGYFDNGVQLANAVLAGADRLREFQLGTARDIQKKYVEIAGRLANAKSAEDLMALQSALMRDYSAGAVGYWTKLSELLQQTQGRIAATLEKQGTRVLEQASASVQAPAQLYGAPRELIAVMQNAFDAARGANEAFLKALAHHPAAAGKKATKAAQANA